MRSVLFLVVVLAVAACASQSIQAVSVEELPFSEEPRENCEVLFMVSGTGVTQEAARTQVYEAVASAGGNAVVFVGAIADRDTNTGKLTQFTERAIAYRCEK